MTQQTTLSLSLSHGDGGKARFWVVNGRRRPCGGSPFSPLPYKFSCLSLSINLSLSSMAHWPITSSQLHSLWLGSNSPLPRIDGRIGSVNSEVLHCHGPQFRRSRPMTSTFVSQFDGWRSSCEHIISWHFMEGREHKNPRDEDTTYSAFSVDLMRQRARSVAAKLQ
jgi:hypothetical protein